MPNKWSFLSIGLNSARGILFSLSNEDRYSCVAFRLSSNFTLAVMGLIFNTAALPDADLANSAIRFKTVLNSKSFKVFDVILLLKKVFFYRGTKVTKNFSYGLNADSSLR